MKRNMRSLFSLMAITLSLVAIVAGCTDKSTQGQNARNEGVVLRTMFATPALLGSVNFVRLTVTGPELEPISLDSRYPDSNAALGCTLDFDGSAIYAALDVDCGADRVFLIEAVHSSPVGAAADEVVIYRGEQTVSVMPNRATTIGIVLEPAVPLVRFMPRRIEGEAGEPFAVDILVAGIDSLTSISLRFVAQFPDRVSFLTAEPSEELVAAVGDGLVFTARFGGDAMYFQVDAARESTYEPIVDAAGNRRLCTVYLSSAVDTAQPALDSLVTSLTMSVYSALKSQGTLEWVDITGEVYTDNAAIHLGLLENRIVTFDDPEVEDAVRNKIEQPTGDIMLFSVLPVYDLDLIERARNDLGGLEALVNLEVLWIDYTEVSDLSPLSELWRLVELTAQSASLTDISPLSGLTNLRILDLSYNSITNIQPLSGLTHLSRLNLARNQITDISALEDLTWLTNLNLANNQITDIYPLVSNSGLGLYDTLDLRGNASIPNDATQLEYIATLQSRGVIVYYQILR